MIIILNNHITGWSSNTAVSILHFQVQDIGEIWFKNSCTSMMRQIQKPITLFNMSQIIWYFQYIEIIDFSIPSYVHFSSNTFGYCLLSCFNVQKLWKMENVIKKISALTFLDQSKRGPMKITISKSLMHIIMIWY